MKTSEMSKMNKLFQQQMRLVGWVFTGLAGVASAVDLLRQYHLIKSVKPWTAEDYAEASTDNLKLLFIGVAALVAGYMRADMNRPPWGRLAALLAISALACSRFVITR